MVWFFRKSFFIPVLLLFLLASSVFGWGCGNRHCLVRAGSIYFQKLDIHSDPNREDYGLLDFYIDLNYINGAVPPSELGVEGVDWYVYYFNNWYSSKYIDLSDGAYFEITPLDPRWSRMCVAKEDTPFFSYYFICYEITNQTLCEAEEYCEWQVKDIFHSTNFLGLPFYLHKCYVDCDYQGSEDASCVPDGDYDAVYDFSKSEYKDIINLNGNAWLNNTFSELYATPGYLLTQGVVRANIKHRCEWPRDGSVRNAQIVCELAPNLYYRHSSAEDTSWTYEDIIPGAFPGYGFNDRKIQVCTGLTVNMSVSQYNPWDANFSVGLSDEELWEKTDEGIKDFYGSPGLVKQYKSNLEVVDLRNRLEWQMSVIDVIDVFSGFALLIYYVVVLSAVIGVVFVKFPGLLRKILNTFKEFTKVRRG